MPEIQYNAHIKRVRSVALESVGWENALEPKWSYAYDWKYAVLLKFPYQIMTSEKNVHNSDSHRNNNITRIVLTPKNSYFWKHLRVGILSIWECFNCGKWKAETCFPFLYSSRLNMCVCINLFADGQMIVKMLLHKMVILDAHSEYFHFNLYFCSLHFKWPHCLFTKLK